MVPRRLYPWSLAFLVLAGLPSVRLDRGPDPVHRQCHEGLQPGERPQHRGHPGEQQSAEHRPVAVDHAIRAGSRAGASRTSGPTTTPGPTRSTSAFNNFKNAERADRALRPGQRRPVGDARPPTIPRTSAATSRSRWPSHRSTRRARRSPAPPWRSPAFRPTRRPPARGPTASRSPSTTPPRRRQRTGLPVRQGADPGRGQLPGLRSLAVPSPARVHHQELQQDPRARSHQGLLDLGLRGIEPRRSRGRGVPLVVEGPRQRRAEHPRADHLAGLDARHRRGRAAASQPAAGPILRFGPSN